METIIAGSHATSADDTCHGHDAYLVDATPTGDLVYRCSVCHTEFVVPAM